MRRKILRRSFLIFLIFCFTFPGQAQFEKNPVQDIRNGEYTMVIEKFVRIPDDSEGEKPRINSFDFTGERIFASTEEGMIYEISGGNVREFFNVQSAVEQNTGRLLDSSDNPETGLRSIAFHPDFSENGKFYTTLMEERPADTSGHLYITDFFDHIGVDGVLVEWTFDHNSDEVLTNSYREIFRIGFPRKLHLIKVITFNPYAAPGDEDYDLLYISCGDGRQGGMGNNALGKILRINPLQSGEMRYSIPSTNPFTGDDDMMDEVFALGFRNPHSISFVKNLEEEVLFISADPGEDQIEELNRITAGDNFGWAEREGTFVFVPGEIYQTTIDPLPDNEAEYGYTYPAAQYLHNDPAFSSVNSEAIIGGYEYPVAATGEVLYLSADFPASGKILYNRLIDLASATIRLEPDEKPVNLTYAPFYSLFILYDDDHDEDTPLLQKTSMKDVIDDDPEYDNSGRVDLRFGRDRSGNIYLLNKRNGWIYKIRSINPGVYSGNRNHTEGWIERVYPNPVSINSVLKIRLKGMSQQSLRLSILNAEGKLIMNEEIPAGTQQIEIVPGRNGISPGFYILKIINDSFPSFYPVIISD